MIPDMLVYCLRFSLLADRFLVADIMRVSRFVSLLCFIVIWASFIALPVSPLLGATLTAASVSESVSLSPRSVIKPAQFLAHFLIEEQQGRALAQRLLQVPLSGTDLAPGLSLSENTAPHEPALDEAELNRSRYSPIWTWGFLLIALLPFLPLWLREAHTHEEAAPVNETTSGSVVSPPIEADAETPHDLPDNLSELQLVASESENYGSATAAVTLAADVAWAERSPSLTEAAPADRAIDNNWAEAENLEGDRQDAAPDEGSQTDVRLEDVVEDLDAGDDDGFPAGEIAVPVTPVAVDSTGEADINTAEDQLTAQSWPQRLVVNGHQDCYTLSEAQIQGLQSSINSVMLAPGDYAIRIRAGAFSYTDPRHDQVHQFNAEPWIVLWLHGGQFMNKQTRIKASTTWTTLNGYHDLLMLHVIETTTLCGLFFDTFKDDNQGEITLSVLDVTPSSSKLDEPN